MPALVGFGGSGFAEYEKCINGRAGRRGAFELSDSENSTPGSIADLRTSTNLRETGNRNR